MPDHGIELLRCKRDDGSHVALVFWDEVPEGNMHVDVQVIDEDALGREYLADCCSDTDPFLVLDAMVRAVREAVRPAIDSAMDPAACVAACVALRDLLKMEPTPDA